jgi:site-specific recombinase XerD
MVPEDAMSNLIDDFYRWLSDQDKSEQTKRVYLGAVTRFGMWFEKANRALLTAQALTPTDLRLYRDQLVQAKLKPSSTNTNLAALRSLGQFIAEQTKASDPSAKLRGIEVSRHHAPKSLTRQELFKLQRALDHRRAHAERSDHSLLWIVRDEAIITLLLNTGLRVQELCSLDVADVVVNARGGKVIVRQGKGRKHREVPLNANVRGLLRNWLTDRQKVKCVVKDDPALFVTKYRKRIGAESIRYLLSELSQKVGIDASPHSLRHAFGKNLVDAGESLDRVGELLGHRSLDTTRIYTAPTEADLARAVARLEN